MKRRVYTIDPVYLDIYRDWTAKSGHVITSARQQRVIAALVERGRKGITSRELAKIHSKGDVSGTNNWAGAFNFLHKDGVIDKLEERRERHGVYVLPEFVEGRPIVLPYTHGGNKDVRVLREAIVKLWDESGGAITRTALSEVLGVPLLTKAEKIDADVAPDDEAYFFVDAEQSENSIWIYSPASNRWTCVIDDAHHDLFEQIEEAITDKRVSSVFRGFNSGVEALIRSFGCSTL